MKKVLFLIIFPILCWAETVSVIVPCCPKHFYLLPELLYNISLQTKLPDEVVISVSESEKIDINQIKKTEQLSYPFNIKFLFHKERLFAGENRNKACEKAIGDIFITQDADDIPYPQRIEILTYIFKCHPDVQQIIHKWAHPFDISHGWQTLILANIKKTMVINLNHYSTFPRITNGNCAIRRGVFDRIKWSNKRGGEDVEFNHKVFETFKKTMMVDATLLIYRNELSSGR